jgi:hypothetical protein
MTEELARRRAQMAENRKRCREYWATDWNGRPWETDNEDARNRDRQRVPHRQKGKTRADTAETLGFGYDQAAEIKETKGR